MHGILRALTEGSKNYHKEPLQNFVHWN